MDISNCRSIFMEYQRLDFLQQNLAYWEWEEELGKKLGFRIVLRLALILGRICGCFMRICMMRGVFS